MAPGVIGTVTGMSERIGPVYLDAAIPYVSVCSSGLPEISITNLYHLLI